MNTGLVLFTVIVLQWAETTDGGSWPYSVLSVSSEDLKAIGIQTPSWLFASPWTGDHRGKSSLEEEENENESESDERLLKHANKAWNFIKKLKGKEDDGKKKGKGKKKKKTDTGSPLLSGNFLTSLFGEETAANETETADEVSTSNLNATVVPPLLIIDNVSTSDSQAASEETVEVKPTKSPVKLKKNRNKKPVNTTTTTSDENSEEEEEEEDDGDEDSDEDDEAGEDDEEDDENEESDDKHTSDDHDPDEVILDTHPKGPDGSDIMEPADIKMLGKKADLYLRLNKAHQSAKEFLGVFKGVYVDYVKNRPHLGIEVGNLGKAEEEEDEKRSFGRHSYSGISRMGRPRKYYARSDRIYRAHHEPKFYFPNYNDYYEYHDPPKHNDFLIKDFENQNLMYISRRSYGRGRSENLFPFFHKNYYTGFEEPFDYIYY